MNHIKAMQLAMDHLMNLQPILGNGLLEERQLAFIDPHIDCAITALQKGLAEQPAQQEPVGVVNIESHSTHGWKVADFELTKALPFGRHLLYTSPPAQRKEDK